MKKIYFSLIALLFFVTGSFAQTVVVAGADAGTLAGNPYTTLGAAFTSINAANQAGNIIVITVTGVTTEPSSAVLNQSAGPWTSLTIIPVGASQITGNIAGHLVDLNGADNVTIDGLNAAGNSLAINNANSGSASSTIRFVNDATNNLINKVNILGSAGNALGSGFGVVYFGGGTTTGNDNNTINQCSISPSSNGTPLNAIYSLGTSAVIDNSNNTISVNNISDYFSAGSASAGMNINSNNSGWTITNNALYQTATRTATTASTHNGILITSGSGYTISNNVIGFAAPNATGTTNYIGLTSGSLGGTFPSSFTAGGTANATRYNAINCAFTTGGAASSIQNNTIGGIALYTSSGATTTFGLICGIAVTSGNANIGTVTGNTIGSTTATGSLYAATTTAGGIISGIYCTTSNTITIQNNNIGGIDVSGTTATQATGFKGIEGAGAGTYVISNNNVGSTLANNIRAGYLLTAGNLSNAATTPTTATGASAIQGILSSATGTSMSITNNTLRGFQFSGSATTFTGINSTGAVTGTIDISSNNLGTAGRGLVAIAFATSGGILCINNSGGSAACVLTMNNNIFQGVSYNNECTGSFRCLNNSAAVLSYSMNNNNFNNLTVNTSAQTFGFLIGATNNTPTVTINGNFVTGQFSNITPTGASNLFAIACASSTTATGSSTITNNNLSNITFRTTTSFGAAIYWLNGNVAASTHNININNNIVSNLTNNGIATTASTYGIVAGNGNTNVISNNTVTAVSGKAQVIGIVTNAASLNATGSFAVNNNLVYNISSSTASSQAQGIQCAAGPTQNTFKNKVYDITCTGAGTVIGIIESNATAGTTANIYNNIIGRLYAPNSGFFQAVRGINLASSVANTANVYYNTVYLDGNCPGNSYGAYINSTVPTFNLRNNIIINNAVATGGLEQIGVFIIGALTAQYATTSNNNIIYAGTPGALHLIYGDGAAGAITNPQQTLAAFQAFVGPTRENVSKTENTPFVNSTNGAAANYLHINSNTTQAESGAANIVTYTDDYDGNIRQGNGGYIGTGTAPDIGADEFEYSPTIDMGATTLVTPPVNGCRTTTETVTIRITNYGGATIDFSVNNVTVSATATGPNAYASSAIVNSGTLAQGATLDVVMPATFDMTAVGTYTFNASTSVAGDVDASNDAMAATTRNSGVFGGTYTVGVAGNYPTLTAAVTAYNNAGCFNNNVVFSLIDVTYSASESFPIVINSNAAAGVYTLTIKPAAANTATITGNNTVAIIKLNGADNVIIDGSNNGTNSQNLTIANTNTTSGGTQGVIWLSSPSAADGATNNTIKNCILTGNAATTSFYCVGSTGATALTSAPSPNSNNRVQNNTMDRAQEGVFILGNAATSDDGWLISNNAIGTVVTSIGFNGLYLANMKNYAVNNNTIANINTNANPYVAGIEIEGVHTNGSIYSNNINTIFNSGTSATAGSYGIYLASTNTASNLGIFNNFISNVRSGGNATVSSNGFGIYGFSGGGYNIYYNSIALSTNQTNANGTTAPINITSGITTAGSVNLVDNIFANKQTTSTRYSIYSTAANNVFASMDYNDYYNAGTNLAYQSGNLANLAALQGAGGFGVTNNVNSLNVNPNFTSTTDLHLVVGTNCQLDGYGTPLSGFTTDYDVQTRDAVAPDMGADEFSTTPVPSTMATASNCDTKNVSPLGTLYLDGSCNLIAKVLPSGGSAVNGKIRSCVTLDGTQQTFNGQPYVQRHYDIEPTNTPATATGTITLYFTDAEFAQYNTNYPAYPPLPTVASGGNGSVYLGNVKVTQFHGVGSTNPTQPGFYPGTTVLITPVTTFYNGSFWELTFNVTGFSGFYVHTNNFNAPLPIIVNYLTGRKQGSNHLLNWKVTCASTPRATMTLERSSDSRNYTGINTITADAARCNQPFDYTDANPLKGMNYYRLKIIDADGHVTYSTTVALLNAAKGFDIISIAPNPVVNNDLKLNVTSAQAGTMEISIFDMQGRLVNRQTLSLVGGYNTLPVNVVNLQPGTYAIRGSMADDQSKVIRFVKQ